MHKIKFSQIIALIIAIILYILSVFFGFYIVSGDSMEPSFYNGDEGIYLKGKYANVKEGDVVLVHDPDTDEGIIKRCIAVGGDTVSMEKGVLYVNGEAVDEEYTLVPMGEHDYIDEIKLSEDEIYVMGDNRGKSYDSRLFGALDIDGVDGVSVINLSKHGLNREIIIFVIVLAFLVTLFISLFQRRKEE